MSEEKNCPYCGLPMKDGRIESEGGAGLFWFPKDQSLIIKTKKKISEIGGLVLDGPFMTRFNTAFIAASYCESCRTIIIKL
jgi:hypothetical protein